MTVHCIWLISFPLPRTGAAPQSNLFYGIGDGSVFTVQIEGNIATIVGQVTDAGFTGASDVTSDAQGNIYVRRGLSCFIRVDRKDGWCNWFLLFLPPHVGLCALYMAEMGIGILLSPISPPTPLPHLQAAVGSLGYSITVDADYLPVQGGITQVGSC